MKNDFIKNIKKTIPFIKGNKKYLVGYTTVSLIEAVDGAIVPLFFAKVILGFTDSAINQAILSAIGLFICNGILDILDYFKGYFYQKIYISTLINLQSKLASETLNLEIKELDKESSGLFIDRLNDDTQDIAGLFMEYTYWSSSMLSKIGILISLFILNKYLFIYAVLTSLCIFFISKKRLNKQYKINADLKKINERKTGLIGELVRGMRDIKVLNANNAILKQTKDKIMESAETEIKMLNTRRKYYFFEMNLRTLSEFIFIILGIILYNNNLITIPTFIIVLNYRNTLDYLLDSIVQLSEFNKKFTLAANRIFEVIDNNRFSKESFGNLSINKLNGNISFKNVSFSYNDNKKIINNMSFEINQNEKIAFVGKSGVGKSTIFNLITKLYSIDKGHIFLDKYDINDLDQSSLRDNMSIITQSPYIFNFSIKDNLLLAKENASMKEIREACKLACIDDFIMSLPKKYNTKVGENGIILSGGQKQRLAIARALLMKTKIILFDEATSALDNETQSEIQNAIDNLKGEYTLLIIAHRLSTVVDCDKIFVVDNGKVIDSGSHKELLKKCKFYKELYEKDLNI